MGMGFDPPGICPKGYESVATGLSRQALQEALQIFFDFFLSAPKIMGIQGILVVVVWWIKIGTSTLRAMEDLHGYFQTHNLWGTLDFFTAQKLGDENRERPPA
jgi:hypothetical protein